MSPVWESSVGIIVLSRTKLLDVRQIPRATGFFGMLSRRIPRNRYLKKHAGWTTVRRFTEGCQTEREQPSGPREIGSGGPLRAL
jgi:hypothetical protein